MRIQEKRICRFLMAPVIALLASCSTGGPPAAADPWAASWEHAEQLFAAGDMDETLRQVEKMLQAPEPYRAKAAAWKLMILAGSARGYYELAEAHQSGSKEDAGQAPRLWRATSTYRSRCRAASLALAEMAVVADRYFSGSDAVELDFPFPTETASRSALVESVAVGRPIPDAQVQAVVDYTVRRGVALTMCEAATGTSWKESGELCVERRAVIPKPRLLAMFGKVLYEQAELFGRKQLDDSNKHALLLDLSEKLLRATLADHQRQDARLEAWRVELANRRLDR